METNNQTSVDFLFKNTFDSFEAYQLKKITLGQFFSTLVENYEHAKQMEKEQMFGFTKHHHVIGPGTEKYFSEEFNKYYNETYIKSLNN